jgi:hypothetical protein
MLAAPQKRSGGRFARKRLLCALNERKQEQLAGWKNRISPAELSSISLKLKWERRTPFKYISR